MIKHKEEVVFECRPPVDFAVRHRWDEAQGRTGCGVIPRTSEWSRGTFAYEHEMPDGEKPCQRCYGVTR